MVKKIVYKEIILLMNKVHEILELNRFYLIGGNVIDYYFQDKFNLNDVDIIIDSTNLKLINKIISTLKKKGFKLKEPYTRRYYLCNTNKVYVMNAVRNDLTLDILFTDKFILGIGPLDAMTMYSKYPSYKLYDEFNCLKALKSRKLNYFKHRTFKNENPYIIISKYIKLCTKYNFSLLNNKKLILEFNSVKLNYKFDKFRSEVYISFISTIFSSILKIKNKSSFISNILDLKILEGSKYSLDNILFESLKLGLFNKLKLSNVFDLLDYLEKNLKNNNNILNVKRIKNQLSKKKW